MVQSENLNQTKIYGIESGIRWRYSNRLEAFAVLNYTRGEERDATSGATVPADRVPPLNGRLGIDYSPKDNLILQAWADFSGHQNRLSPRDVEDPRINPQGTDSHVTLNMLLSWQATPRLELGIRLENLTDSFYREHGSGLDAPGRSIGFWFESRL